MAGRSARAGRPWTLLVAVPASENGWSEPEQGKTARGRQDEARMNRRAQQFWVTHQLASWRPSPGVLAGVGGGAWLAVAVITAPAARHWYNRWRATPAEAAGAMPGDDLIPHPKMTSTRAVSIGAPPAEVWAWLAQIGQGRGGFYSYDVLENLARCDIHSAGHIIPEFQPLHPGDLIRLAPGQAPCFRVATAEPSRVLVLAAADPVTHAVRPVATTPDELGSTWQWLLRPVDGGQGTRLLARQRYSYPARQSVLWHLVEPVSFVMERRMLLGIKARAETHVAAGLAGSR
jgi:hypothetical protein